MRSRRYSFFKLNKFTAALCYELCLSVLPCSSTRSISRKMRIPSSRPHAISRALWFWHFMDLSWRSRRRRGRAIYPPGVFSVLYYTAAFFLSGSHNVFYFTRTSCAKRVLNRFAYGLMSYRWKTPIYKLLPSISSSIARLAGISTRERLHTRASFFLSLCVITIILHGFWCRYNCTRRGAIHKNIMYSRYICFGQAIFWIEGLV